VFDEVHLHTMRSSDSGFSCIIFNLCQISRYCISTGSILAPCVSCIQAPWTRPDSTEWVFHLNLGTAAVTSGTSWAMEHLLSHLLVQKHSRCPLPGTIHVDASKKATAVWSTGHGSAAQDLSGLANYSQS
jgi:hypothetical protein